MHAQVEHEVSMKQQNIETLERQVLQLKERLSQVEFTKNNSYERQIEHFEQQRNELNARIDKYQHDNLEKEKVIASLTHKMERTSDALDRKTSDFAQVREQLEREKAQLVEQLETKKLRLTEEQEKNMQLNLDSSREQALLEQ